jgi:hypothetical protein
MKSFRRFTGKVGAREFAEGEPLTKQDVRAMVEEILSQHKAAPRGAPQNEIIGFDELVTRLPLGARSLQTRIKDGTIPHIKLPGGGRKLLFSWPAVVRAIERFSKGGIE